ncbi:acetylcholinesterase-like [Saccoglossus kowalevskii]|uniref:Neuroligin-4, Y-linked-like n=1 Tax=Saccoglossus kowalevskii TaxID=10224 RepID=A0ABM0LU66_SACKO|nr:PREDICTED: neuroligin-4, Y-linked-like [Saccoglossus kowalevskii]
MTALFCVVLSLSLFHGATSQNPRLNEDIIGGPNADERRMSDSLYLGLEYVEITLPYYGVLQGRKFRLVTPWLTYVREKIFWAEQFLGIPFARPPVGELRFQRPVHADPWQGVYSATYHRSACPQTLTYIQTVLPDFDSRKIQEDCLYLNVYRPSRELGIYDPLLPVMVYFHGGDWDYGTAEMYNGTFMSATRDVIVVTTNYRLGALGFLCTEDEYSLGNYGLWDQLEALKWVQENIQHFGGDSRRVTVFGGGAGGASVGLSLMSPSSEGLFERAIMQSGTAVSPFAVILPPYKPKDSAVQLGEAFNCPTTYSSYELVECLKSLPYSNIYLADIQGSPDAGAWAPVIDGPGNGRYLPGNPYDLLVGGHFREVDIINGIVKEERSYKLLDIPGVHYGVRHEYFMMGVHDEVSQRHIFGVDTLTNISVFEYTNWTMPLDETSIRDQYIDMLTDRDFVAPMIQTNRYHDQSSAYVFMYTFNYTGEVSPFPAWMGVPHGGELPYVFGEPMSMGLQRQNWTNDDRTVSDLMMTMWSNFAKYGNPTPMIGSVSNPPAYQEPEYPADEWDYVDLEWYPYKFIDNETYIHIDINSTMRKDYRLRKTAFWNILIPNLGETPSSIRDRYYYHSIASFNIPNIFITICFCVTVFIRG